MKTLHHFVISPLTLLISAGLAPGGGFECRCGKAHWAHALHRSPAGSVDDATGRDLRNFPPHLFADYVHMSLDMVIEDMNTPVMLGTQRLTFIPKGESLTTLSLDAKGLEVESASLEGRETTFSHDGSKLALTFDPALPVGTPVTLVTRYTVRNPPFGLIWTAESAAHPGRAAQLHTQGEPQTNSYWFPCHDFPNDKLTTEVSVTLPAGYLVSSNGRLAEHRKVVRRVGSDGASAIQPFERFHWKQETPHTPYLVTLIAGKFDVVDVGTAALSMSVYVPPGQSAGVAPVFGRTAAMVEYFSDLLDEPYPWDRYAQLSVYNFGWGGMENTSATTLHENVVVPPELLAESDQDGLIAHELAHQWFGDLLTCNSWEHIWLNEGFATFLDTHWIEVRDGRDAYLAQLRGTFDGVISADSADAPNAVGMASKIYKDPWDTFSRPANPYGKGASILHMLRSRLGDEVFFKGVAAYVDAHKLQTVETDDLRRALEAVSGESLEQFFSQWVYRPGVPHLNVTPRWNESDGTLHLTIEQTQTINGDNPAFEFDLPFSITSLDGSTHQAVAAVAGRSAEVTLPLPSPPRFVVADAGLTLLAAITLSQDQDAWAAQLRGGATLPARIQAARALASGSAGSPLRSENVSLVAAIASDVTQPAPLRTELVRTLVEAKADDQVQNLAFGVADRWEMREATSNALADVVERWGDTTNFESRDRILAALAARAKHDPSQKVRGASLRALGRLKSVEHLGLIRSSLDEDSWADEIRQASLDAMRSYDSPESLSTAISLSRAGHDSRTRAAAVSAIPSLARHDPDVAFACVAELAGDSEPRTRAAAGEALAAIGDPRGIQVLDAALAAAKGPEARYYLEKWLKDLRDKAGSTAAAR